MTRCEAPSAEMHVPDAATPVNTREAPASGRRWITPALCCHSTLTVVTQVGSPLPLSLLFLQASNQCFNSRGNPASCT